jgi:hypothetical protein
VSLIHQVLQDLDSRREFQPGEVAGYAEEHQVQRLAIWPALVVSIVCAVSVIYFSDYFRSEEPITIISPLPVIPVAEPNKVKVVESDVLPQTAVQSAVQPSNQPSNQSSNQSEPTNELPELLSVTPAESALALLVEPEVVNVSDVSSDALFQLVDEPVNSPSIPDDNQSVDLVLGAEQKSITTKTVSSSSIIKKAPSNTQVEVAPKASKKSPTASVIRRTSAEDYYVKAIAYYRNGDWQASLLELENASKLSGVIDYQAMKARIFLEQGLRDDFYAVYQSNSENRNISWLSVIAPGLHMFGLYSDAVDQYSRLSSLQPGNVEWPIAKTQALVDAGMVSQAKSELQHIEENYSLNDQQSSWLRYQQKTLE